MATTAAKTATPRSRARKPAATTATPAATAPEAPAESRQKLTFTLAPMGDTKNYSTFDISKDVEGNATGCVGKFYAPLGTEVVKILVEGPMGEAE